MKSKVLTILFSVIFFNVSLLQAIDEKPILIAYYSWSGNTAYAARQIQKACGSRGELFEIKPVKPYPNTYKKCVKQAKLECKTQFTPEITEPLPDLNKYDTIFIGTPNWWGTMAPPVLSFIKKNNFENKTVVLFVTHDGGSLQQCSNDFNACFGSKTNILKPEAFLGKDIKKLDDKLVDFANNRLKLKGE